MRGRRASVLSGGAAFAIAVGVWIRCGPLPQGFLDPRRHVSIEIVDRHGELLYEMLSHRGGRSAWLSSDHLPERLSEATLAAEDKRFFQHPGVDPLALLRAAWRNLAARRVREGGSTLTQQCVKLLSGRRRSLPGKLREMLLALRLEHRLSKKEILALYLNLAPYGNQHTGAASASRGYFDCAPENLTAAQAAFLAALPQRPTALDPYRNFGSALRRQAWVLSRLEALGVLSPVEARHARAERLRLTRGPKSFTAPHFVERVLASRRDNGARRILTTLDAALQHEVRGILETRRVSLREHGAHNVAVAVLDNATGEWLAWEGSGDYFDQQHGGAIDGVITPRQPGSALKPFTYALAFEKGFTPASVLPDIPSHFPTAEPGILYSPRNYDGVFRGPLRARIALAGSENVPAVWLLSRVGVPELLSLLRRAGLTTLDKNSGHYGFALTMGDAEVRLSELVAAYAVFARGGVYSTPRMVRGERARGWRILSERASFWVTDILSDPRARQYIFGAGGSLDFPFPAAVKTGTSQAYRDNWTVGFTKEVTVGVWVGNFDRSELRNSSGVTGAAPIFHAVLEAAVRRVAGSIETRDAPLAEPPSGLAPRSLCALSGLDATQACPALETEWLPSERAPFPCGWHLRRGAATLVAWPPEFRAWARARALTAARAVPAESRREGPLRIQNPPAGAVYLRDPTLRAAYQTLPLRAVAAGGRRPLRWQIDGRTVGRRASDEPLHWPLASGKHTVRVTDDRGFTDETAILVK